MQWKVGKTPTQRARNRARQKIKSEAQGEAVKTWENKVISEQKVRGRKLRKVEVICRGAKSKVENVCIPPTDKAERKNSGRQKR